MAQSSEIKLNKRFDQNIEITGTLTVGGNNVLTSFDITTQTDPKYLRSDSVDVIAGSFGNNEILKFQNNSSGNHIQIGFQQNDTDGLHHRAYFRTYKSDAGLAAGKFDLIVRSAGGGTTGDVLELEAGENAKWRGNVILDSNNVSSYALTSLPSHNHDGVYQPLNTTLSRFSESNWAGGGSYPGYTFSGGNTRFGLSSTAGVLDLYVDGNFYATDSAHLVIHAGNIGSQSVSYASNAGTLDSLDSTEFARGRAAWQQLNFDSFKQPGLYQYDSVAAGGGTAPPDVSPYNFRTIEIGSENRYSQIALPFNTDNIYFRKHNGSWGSWRTVIHDGNISSQSVNYATTAANADTVDNLHASSFLRSDANDTVNGTLTFSSRPIVNTGATENGIRFRGSNLDFVGRYSDYVSLYNQISGGEIRMYDSNYIILNSPDVRVAGNHQVIHGGNIGSQTLPWGNITSKPAGWLNNAVLIEDKSPNATAFPSGFYQHSDGAVTPTGTWFNYINVRHSNTSNGHGFQLGMSYYDNNLWFRSYKGGLSPTFESWEKAIGSGSSNQTKTGYLQSNDSLRAPIFYDSNDTTYYANPNSDSLFKQLRCDNASAGWSAMLGAYDVSRTHNDSARHGLVINAGYYPHIDLNATATTDTNPTHGAVISMTGKLGSGYRRWGMGIAQYNPNELSFGYADNQTNPHHGVGINWSSGAKMWIDTGGHLYSTGSMRSPIFYDSNDTNYFLNPASNGSKLKNIVINPQSESWSEGIRFDMPTQGVWGGLRWSRSGASSNSGNWALGYAGNIGNSNDVTWWSGTGNHWWRMDHSGNVQIGGSSRAPIFYDLNNTGYYCDPASTSNFSALTLQGQPQNNPQHNRFFNATTYSWSSPTMYYRYTKVAHLSNSTSRATFKYYCKKDANYPGAVHGVVNIATYASASMSVQHDQLGGDGQITPEVYIDNNRDIWIRMAGSAWSSHVTWHWIYNSGVTIYDGSTQSNTDPGNGLYRIQPGESFRFTWGNTSGPTHYQTTNYCQNLTSRNSVYSPIYYDLNSTGYYIDAASTSNINNLHLDGYIHVSKSNTTGNGIILADDGDIVDLNDAYCSMRFSYGVRVFSANRGGSAVHTLHSNGTFTASGDVVAYSDIRVKENIEPITNALEIAKNIEGVYYNRTDKEDKSRKVGVIAQQIKQVLPEVVTEDDQGMLGVSYGNITAVLIEAVKELSNKVEELENKLNGTEL